MERIAFWSPLASIVAIASHFSRLVAGAFKREYVTQSQSRRELEKNQLCLASPKYLKKGEPI